MSLVSKLIKRYVELRGWTTDRHLVVIESDDWGSERIPDIRTFNTLAKDNLMVADDPFCRYDTIASAQDLEALFEVLQSVKDHKGQAAKITANTIVANPDYRKIQEGEYEQYFYEPSIATIQRKDHQNRILHLWEEGVEEGLMTPQLHGREHLHALAWLRELRAENVDLLAAFKEGVYAVGYRESNFYNKRRNLQAALDLHGIDGEMAFQENYFAEGARLFQQRFDFTSTTYIATAYIWHQTHEALIRKIGVQALQGLYLQYSPKKNRFVKKLHFNGQKRKHLVYTCRNSFFEPSLISYADNGVDHCLAGVARAFKNRQPAIIGSHRVNFIGALQEHNRTKNLRSFKTLLREMVKNWPRCEFITSDELAVFMQV